MASNGNFVFTPNAAAINALAAGQTAYRHLHRACDRRRPRDHQGPSRSTSSAPTTRPRSPATPRSLP
ncbi:MAG: hypothetical protein MZW92_07095 [Comamonadaceae bacterium]|nr:hypothetical protein [Comamonadaceae bacterium]